MIIIAVFIIDETDLQTLEAIPKAYTHPARLSQRTRECIEENLLLSFLSAGENYRSTVYTASNTCGPALLE